MKRVRKRKPVHDDVKVHSTTNCRVEPNAYDSGYQAYHGIVDRDFVGCCNWILERNSSTHPGE